MERWGWVHNTKQVADFENITIIQAYQLPIIQYLNDLAYLKDYNKYQDLKYKQWELQHKNR